MSDFQKLNLSTKILGALKKKGYVSPTPIQSQSIPHLLEGRDLLGIAQTGTGKTAAFALPILDNLTKSNEQVKANSIRSLILTPTRELASQIADNISGYGFDSNLRNLVIFGGVSINNQIKSLKQGFDIVIATPGRLLDLMSQGHVRFAQLEIFVLDEADRMLDMGFIRDVKKIISKLPKKRQTLLFSATMPADISNLAESILNNPVKVEVTPQSTTVEKIDQRVNLVEKSNKLLLLQAILSQDNAKSVLVFSKTKHGANRVVKYLTENNIGAAAIHGNKSQLAREKSLEDFRLGKNKVLVATDIAARGIDIPNITHVINFDIPQDPESYVHRIGRTARAGKSGIAISLCDNSEKLLLKAVEKAINYKIPIDETHPFHGKKANPLLRNYTEFRDEGFNERKKSRYSPNSNSRKNLDRNFTQDKSDSNQDKKTSKPRSFNSKFSNNNEGRPERRSFGDSRKPEERSERRSFGDSGKFGERSERRSFGDSGKFGERSEKPAFGDSRKFKSPYKSQKSREDNYDDFRSKPKFGNKASNKPYLTKFNSRDGEERSERRSFGDSRKPSERRSFGDSRKPEERSERRSFGDSRKFEDRSEKSSFSDSRKSSFNSSTKKKPFSKNGKSFGNKSFSQKKSGSGKNFGSKK